MWEKNYMEWGQNFSIPCRPLCLMIMTPRGYPMVLGNFSIHPVPYIFSTFIRDIVKILAWIGHFSGKNGIFLYVNLTKGGPYGFWENFSTHPIPNNFCEKIREIFKSLWKR